MTREEATEMAKPFEEKAELVKSKLKALKVENYANQQLYERHKEYLLGQADAYADIVSSFLSIQLKITLSEVRENLNSIKG
ncbi:MAG: hypothetical protein LPJ89_04255 [Hymenobacteraceae bacterium]|nr:hypothetical protein [Hymenobacteraceae bacterium]MDX5396273.1 hypothetical protein [Hymenobacteraceae bacterium]MDX5442977.1 hypothetical protein [Hymenobacteraceae bacterium]MDX5512334.1 hypothetical protein [Hymenobacteraceae bacterium]